MTVTLACWHGTHLILIELTKSFQMNTYMIFIKYCCDFVLRTKVDSASLRVKVKIIRNGKD